MSKKSGCSRGRSTVPKFVRRGLELGLARVMVVWSWKGQTRGYRLGFECIQKRDIQKADKGGDLVPARALMLGVVLT